MAITILTFAGAFIIPFVVGALLLSWQSAGHQQKMDLLRYGRSSSRTQIFLEIWGIREVR